jgi:hypothetical protein
MFSTINVHGITQIKVTSKCLNPETDCWVMQIEGFDEKNGVTTLTFFSTGPRHLEGAEFVNHVANEMTETA